MSRRDPGPAPGRGVRCRPGGWFADAGGAFDGLPGGPPARGRSPDGDVALEDRPPSASAPAADPERLTGVVAALVEEARPLLRRLSDRRPARVPGHRPTGERPWIVRGRLAGRSIVVVVTGDGERHARAGLRRAFETLEPSEVVVIGVAAGLAPDLAPGDLVVGSRVVSEDGRTLAADPSLVASLLTRGAGSGAREGAVATVGHILDTPASKSALRGRAEPGRTSRKEAPVPDVADLESAAYAAEAERAGLPWVVLRAVSDTASERLPAYLEACRDASGAVRRGAVTRRALARPWTIPSLLRLRRRVREGGLRLADTVQAILGSTKTTGPTNATGSMNATGSPSGTEAPGPAR